MANANAPASDINNWGAEFYRFVHFTSHQKHGLDRDFLRAQINRLAQPAVAQCLARVPICMTWPADRM
jgi:hypothetical protein